MRFHAESLKEGQEVSVKEFNPTTGQDTFVYGEVVEHLKESGNVLIRHPSRKNVVVGYPIEAIHVREVEIMIQRLYSIFGQKCAGRRRLEGLRNRISEIMINSDGAASHFQQRGTLFMFTQLRQKHSSWLVAKNDLVFWGSWSRKGHLGRIGRHSQEHVTSSHHQW